MVMITEDNLQILDALITPHIIMRYLKMLVVNIADRHNSVANNAEIARKEL